MRRESGARREVNEAVVFRKADSRIEGWCLNISPGGLRAIVEGPVEVDEELFITVGDSGSERPARVVWVRAERDGAIVGVAFTDVESSAPPPEDSEPPAGAR
jgi:hypothetical protein